jgi:hypothetical protein
MLKTFLKKSKKAPEQRNMISKDQNEQKLPIMGTEAIMSRKKHGTSDTPVQENLRWGCDRKKADEICNFNVSTCTCPDPDRLDVD